MDSWSRCVRLVVPVVWVLLCVWGADSASAQGLAETPYSAPSVLRRGGLDLGPWNPLGLPGSTGGLPQGADSLYLSSGMLGELLGPIPNLQVGYLYRFGAGTAARAG